MDSIKRLARRATQFSQSTNDTSEDSKHGIGADTSEVDTIYSGTVTIYDWRCHTEPADSPYVGFLWTDSKFSDIDQLETFLRKVKCY